jgi:dTDP-4-dehydrorhamnose reductase
MTRILVLGSRGQVGYELRRTMAPLGDVVGLDYPQIDLSDLSNAVNAVEESQADIVCNAVAHTQVDKAEDEPDVCRRLNAGLPQVLAEACKKRGALLVHYSTDYVYEGNGTHARTETEPTKPLSVYGLTKLEGDQAIANIDCEHLIFRLQWVYGARGNNFLRTMRKLFREREELKIVDDQVGSPTWSRAIAEATAQAVASQRKAGQKGVYHMAGPGFVSWHGFATAIRDLDPVPDELVVKSLLPVPSSTYPTKAVRPLNSRLDCDKLQRDFGLRLPSWRTQLEQVLED